MNLFRNSIFIFLAISSTCLSMQQGISFDAKNLKGLFNFQKSSINQYLNNLHIIANLLCAQEELAELLIELNNSSAELATILTADNNFILPEYSPISTSIRKDLPYYSIQLKQFLHSHKIKTPEGISYTIKLINTLTFDAGLYFDWKEYEPYLKSNNEEIQILTKKLFENKRFFDQKTSHERINLELISKRNKIVSLYKEGYKNLFIPDQLKNYIEYFQNYLMEFNNVVASIQSQQKFFQMIKSIPKNVSPQEVTKQVKLKATKEIDSEVVNFTERLNSAAELFLQKYNLVRNETLQLYETIRAEIASQLLRNLKDQELKKYLIKDFDTEKIQLPKDLQKNKEQVSEKTAFTPELNKITEKKKKTNKKNKNKSNIIKEIRNKKEQNEDKNEDVASSLIETTPTPNESFNGLIEHISDPINKMDIYLYCSIKQKKEIKTFAYHPRIFEWFTKPEEALNRQGYTDLNNVKFKLKETAVERHSFHLNVDKIAYKYGTQYEEIDKQGKKIFFIALPGHIEKNNKRIFGIFGYAIDPETKTCYHRCFEEKTTEQLLDEYLIENSWKIKLEQLRE